ncbi:hypothetical protein G6F35_019092 [Rhizopus arrhizus]|nr:hypothetical protein G6F35_019092 [Rhizopus arrhizus]
MIAHAEYASDRKDGVRHPIGRSQDQIVDGADLFLLAVVDGGAAHLRRAVSRVHLRNVDSNFGYRLRRALRRSGRHA